MMISTLSKRIGATARNVLPTIAVTAVRGLLFLGVVAVLSACQPVPMISAEPVAVNLNTFPQPACLIFCTVHLSTIREDVVSGDGAVTTGAKSASQSSATERAN